MKKDNPDKSRRKFIKTGLTSVAGIAILPALLNGDSADPEETKDSGKVINRILGRTGIELPIVGLGVGHINDPDVVRAALEKGIKMLDTAHTYQQGRNEEMVGEAVKGRSRDSFVVVTKVTGPEDQRTGLFTKACTKKMFIDKFNTSLERLGLEYVDVLYIHSVGKKESVMYGPFVEALEEIKKEGKTKFVGVSTHTNEPEVIRAAAESGFHDVVLTAYNFRQPHLKDVEKAMSEAATSGLGIVAMKTQAGVFWDSERTRQINMKAALKWVLRNKNVHTSIPGITTFTQLETDFSVMEDLEFTPEEKSDLEVGILNGFEGLYCRQCRKCVDQCRNHIDIPTMMRAYMYVYGYGNLRSAKEALDTVDTKMIDCTNCGTCSVNCSMGFNVQERVSDIARLGSVPDDFVLV